MRLSKSLVPTLREDPADAEALSHKLMLRAGLVRQLAAGIYVWLPLGQRVLDRINAVIRAEMNAIGGQEMTMPVLHPAEIWRDSGRWDAIGPEMFRLKDRNDRDMCLGMTHEEVIAWLAARAIRSYRDLPQIWYQIQTKERDEARPRSGVLRTREFVMKDSYTLDPDVAALDRSYAAHEGAYRKIFERCGLRFRPRFASTSAFPSAPSVPSACACPCSPTRRCARARSSSAPIATASMSAASCRDATSRRGSSTCTPWRRARRVCSAARRWRSSASSRSATSSSSARNIRKD